MNGAGEAREGPLLADVATIASMSALLQNPGDALSTTSRRCAMSSLDPRLSPVSDGGLCACTGACTVASVVSPAGEVVVVRVVGEIDLSSVSILQDTLTAALRRGPAHLVVDLAGVTFCGLRGLALLVSSGTTAAAQGTVFAVSGASALSERVWSMLWRPADRPVCHSHAAAGVPAAYTSRPEVSARGPAATVARDRGVRTARSTLGPR